MLSVATIEFAQMLEAVGAHAVVTAMARHFGLSDDKMNDVIAWSGPVFLHGYERWMDSPGGVRELNRLVRSGGPQQFAEKPRLVPASVFEQEGRNFFERLFVDDEAVESVTEQLAAQVDIDAQRMAKLMPGLAALFVGVVCKSVVP